ncbi:DUF6119 family protein [Nocardia macrotermitis]|uniref:Sporadically distributed protein, TIGR04141 family n=1 Tax=Nocardia macrotermitis TaxID=2585198 RepID=A0A7K0CXD0_9NOCA|nr:DUF6119 family protein [Nocardia macrotermitis]MQY18081.1 hypothetical protein [Nocardia macrotermitis]
MSRRSSISKRMNLYRMAEDTALPEALREQYREPSEKFAVRPVDVAGSRALLVEGAFEGPSAWTEDISRLAEVEVSQDNRSPGAVLVIQDNFGALWALTWGVGFQLLDQEKVDFRFGTRVLARSALPREIKSITRSVLGHRARVDHTVLPGGSTTRGFGVDGYGEIINRVDATARIPGLAWGNAPIRLHAKDSLSLPLGRRPERLVADLQVLNKLLDEPVLPGLESIERLVALKPKDPMVAELNNRLATRLLGKSDEPIGISWPHARAGMSNLMESCRVRGLGRAGDREDIPEIDEVLTWFTGKDPQSVLRGLGSISLEIHNEQDPGATTPVSTSLLLRHWLAFEVREHASRYCFRDGLWYRMDDRHAERIDQRVTEILAAKSSIPFPPWLPGVEERAYNIDAAAAIDGYSLDRNLMRTALHTHGIEPCDIHLRPGTFIHVKRGRGSSDLSHLFAQTLVSWEALTYDETARAAWLEKISQQVGSPVTDATIDEVVIAIGKVKPITTDSLFTFSKVNLVKQFDLLRDVRVRIAWIPES